MPDLGGTPPTAFPFTAVGRAHNGKSVLNWTVFMQNGHFLLSDVHIGTPAAPN